MHSDITSGTTMSKNTKDLPDWELVLSSAARLQSILPEAVLVGGTASAIYANHRYSRDADHTVDDLYKQDNQESALQQLQAQLANALPYDLEETNLSEYRKLDQRWHDWSTVKNSCAHLSTVIFDKVCHLKEKAAASI